MEALTFPRGNIYAIICMDGGAALRIQGNEPTHYQDSRVSGVQPNASDLGQLFMIEKVGSGKDEFEIVNCLSNLVFDEEGSEIHLRKGKQNSDQLFSVEKAPVQGNTFWIKTSAKGDQALALEGVLRYKAFDPNAVNQLFTITLVNNAQGLSETCIIVNANSGKALDIPNGSTKHGVRVIQYEKNKRFNQRWRWVKNGGGYLIQNLLTGLCLDIEGESKKGGAPVVQWDRTGGSNQTWVPVSTGNGVFKINSVHAPGMFLTIQDQSVKDEGKLEIWDQENPSGYWRIEGFVPH